MWYLKTFEKTLRTQLVETRVERARASDHVLGGKKRRTGWQKTALIRSACHLTIQFRVQASMQAHLPESSGTTTPSPTSKTPQSSSPNKCKTPSGKVDLDLTNERKQGPLNPMHLYARHAKAEERASPIHSIQAKAAKRMKPFQPTIHNPKNKNAPYQHKARPRL